MSGALVIAIALVCLAAGLAAGFWLPPHGRRPGRDRPRPVGRILLPFTGQAISRRAFEAAVRLAKADNATIMPAFLARVPRNLPLESPVPAACAEGMPLLEAIEQRAGAQGVAVDARVARGRTYRDALRRLLDQEQFDRIIVSATDSPRTGLSSEDLEWLLDRVPAEVMILRPAPDDTRFISPNGSHAGVSSARGRGQTRRNQHVGVGSSSPDMGQGRQHPVQ
jgi:nucleotide-binding universal stress UspA family protein